MGFLAYDVHAGVISDAPSVAELLLEVLRFLLSVSAVIGVLAVIVAGVLYMTSAGDTSRVSLAKSALLGSVIGLGIVLTSLVIVTMILNTMGVGV